MLKKLELKVPPLIVTLIIGIIMWSTEKYVDIYKFTYSYLTPLSLFIFISGIIIASVAVFKFKKEDTTVDPTNPKKSEKLVVTGVYKFTRNPMYLSFMLWLLGFGIFLGNPINAIFLVIFICYMNLFQIMPEEKILLSKFGDSFIVYKQNVRRWI